MSNTTIALNEEQKDRLQSVKHEIEKEGHCSYSYGRTVEYLLNFREENK